MTQIMNSRRKMKQIKKNETDTRKQQQKKKNRRRKREKHTNHLICLNFNLLLC
jgi:hypothetical protein